MAEKTYPMTLVEKEKLEQELEELKLVYQKIVNMKQQRTSRLSLKDKFQVWRLKFAML